MNTTEKRAGNMLPEQLAISDEDIYAAMKEIHGYLDITAGDFKELYIHSYRQAMHRLIHSVKAGDIMFRDVVSVKVSTPLLEVAELMASSGISGVPVVGEKGKIAGVLSERDFLKIMGAARASFMEVVAACLRGKGCAALNIRKGTAGDIMSAPAVSVTIDATLGEVAAIMTQRKLNRIPVLDREKKQLCGILTRTDLVKAHVFS